MVDEETFLTFCEDVGYVAERHNRNCVFLRAIWSGRYYPDWNPPDGDREAERGYLLGKRILRSKDLSCVDDK